MERHIFERMDTGELLIHPNHLQKRRCITRQQFTPEYEQSIATYQCLLAIEETFICFTAQSIAPFVPDMASKCQETSRGYLLLGCSLVAWERTQLSAQRDATSITVN